MNANNNTYNCLRTINATHNVLYCEFVTGFSTFYNLRIDPFELQNRVHSLKPEEKLFYHNQLNELVACKGKKCNLGSNFDSNLNSNGNASRSKYQRNQMLEPPLTLESRRTDRRFGSSDLFDGLYYILLLILILFGGSR